jgi:hypothetical protein
MTRDNILVPPVFPSGRRSSAFQAVILRVTPVMDAEPW